MIYTTKFMKTQTFNECPCKKKKQDPPQPILPPTPEEPKENPQSPSKGFSGCKKELIESLKYERESIRIK